MDFFLIALLTLLNGIFAMSELALASSRKARLAALAESGDKGAKAALKLLENPTQFLSSVQVGITSIGMLNGILGEAAFSAPVAEWLTRLGLAAKPAEYTATGLVITIITFVTIVFGELVPKRIGQLYPETMARLISRPMTWIAKIAKPFVALLSFSTQAVLKLLRINNTSDRAVTEEEISASLEEGVDAGLIEEHEHQMVRNVFHLDDRPLTSLMIPRTDIDWLEASFTPAQSLAHAVDGGLRTARSWYPVCRGNLDDVIGMISLAKLMQLGPQHAGPIGEHVTQATFVPETLSGMELLEQFRARSGRMVFVVDEYGVVQGLMTPRDLLEAITGELQPGVQADAWATHTEDGSWILNGLMPVNELKARLEIKELPEEDRGRYNTLAGLMMYVAGNLPDVADEIECAGWTFTVTELEGRRIDHVRATSGVKHSA